MKLINEIDRSKLKYRQSTSAVIVDKLGRFLVVQKVGWKENEWDIPGGGVDVGESPSEAILRELNEELGLKNIEIVRISDRVDRYEWPDELINHKIKEGKPLFRGQERTQFLVKLIGDETKVYPQKEEIKAVKWISSNEIEKFCVFPNQLNKMRKLLEEFGISAE